MMTDSDVPKFPGCNAEWDQIQRVTIIGPQSKSNEVFETLFKNGFRVTRSGPYTNSRMHPRVDITRFLFIAERIVDEEG